MLNLYITPLNQLTAFGISTILLFLLTTFVNVAYSKGGIFQGIQGSFCESRIGGCCPERDDKCHTPILDHLCYCDDFCDGTDQVFREDHDCCPDFHYYCAGLPRPQPPENLTAVCLYEGVPYSIGSIRKNNCNDCKCESSTSSNGRWMCEETECLINPQSIKLINERNLPWEASNYSEFWGRKLSDGITYRLGTLLQDQAVYNMKPVIQIFDPSILPKSFDARLNQNWPNYIQPVTDQGWCGSDWAVSTTAVVADRLAIQSKGSEITKLSSQHLLSCDRGQLGCKGGHLDRAWNFMRAIGVVDEECYPYVSGLTGESGICKMSRRASLHDCLTSNPPENRTQPYKTGPSYRISKNEDDIKYELLTFGPVQAVMEVTPDFFMYKRGVYKRSNISLSRQVGHHSVRILGWGEDFHRGEMIKYWIVANSWGTGWGEDGTFRILRGSNECDIEKFVIASWSRLANEKSYNFKNSKGLKSLHHHRRHFAKWDKIKKK